MFLFQFPALRAVMQIERFPFFESGLIGPKQIDMSLFRILFVTLAIYTATAVQNVEAGILLQYDFGTPPSPSVAPSAQATGVVGSNFLQGDGFNENIDGTISTLVGDPRPSVFLNYAKLPDTYDTTAPGVWLGFTVTPVTGYTLTLSQLAFDYAKNRGAARIDAQLYYSTVISSPAFSDFTAIGSPIVLTGNGWTTDITALSLTAPTFFRLYVYDDGLTESTGAGFHLDNVRLDGDATVNVVPEPSSIVLLGLGGIGLVGTARRRRQAA